MTVPKWLGTATFTSSVYAYQQSVVPQITDRAGNPMDDREFIAVLD